MTWLDYTVLAILAASALLGVWRGMVGEILAIAAWVAAFFAARALAAQAGVWIPGLPGDPVVRYAAGFVAIFAAVLVLVALARWLIALLLKAIGLAPLDRLLGAAFGLVRGGLVVLAAVLLAGLTSLPQSPGWRSAWSAPPLETAAIAVKPWLPAEVAKRIRYR